MGEPIQSTMGVDKRRNQIKVLLVFLSMKTLWYGYSIEAPHYGASDEYPQHDCVGEEIHVRKLSLLFLDEPTALFGMDPY